MNSSYKKIIIMVGGRLYARVIMIDSPATLYNMT